jgi:xylan 1,4-beta-xylosidase
MIVALFDTVSRTRPEPGELLARLRRRDSSEGVGIGAAMMIEFDCDLSAAPVPLAHAWEHTVGSGHAVLALRDDWRRHLQRAQLDLGFGHVRFHGLLNDDMGTVISYNDKLLYSFFNADSIFDHLLSIGMQPFVELSFMPRALASGTTTVFNVRSNVTPPGTMANGAA